jgi:hypothetical protein
MNGISSTLLPDDAVDETAPTNPFTAHSSEISEAGTKLVQEFLDTWAERCTALESAGEADGGEDVVMAGSRDGGGEGDEARMKALKEVAEEFRERIERYDSPSLVLCNPWNPPMECTDAYACFLPRPG